MNIGKILLSLPLKRQTVMGALIIATVLFIIYQFTFVAELNESSKQQRNDAQRDNNNRQVQRKQTGEEGNVNKQSKDVKNVNDKLPNKQELNKENKGKDIDKIPKQINQPNDQKNVEVIKHNQKDVLDGKEENDQLEKEPGVKGKFRCKKSGKVISVEKINDDYCDCPEDGSDEPRTNACNNGRFICIKHMKPFPVFIPSGWVNDGVCDCCDGSDEWKTMNSEAHLPLTLQKKLGLFVPPCPIQCSDAA